LTSAPALILAIRGIVSGRAAKTIRVTTHCAALSDSVTWAVAAIWTTSRSIATEDSRMGTGTGRIRLERVGTPWSDLVREIHERRHQDFVGNDPRNLKASYDAGEDVARIGWEAYSMFRGDNLIHAPSLYPSLPSMATEVVGMALDLLHAPEGAVGTITTGGTESIILAVRTMRNWAKSHHPVRGVPEIVAPSTAHPAFNKAGDLMGLRVVRVPVRDSRGDAEAMAAAMTDNTVMIVGSAPAYPMGCVDPIATLSRLAGERGLWLHVDACIGGFFLPFARQVDGRIPSFDFELPGVMSMSADLHKYGYSARGASLLLLRRSDLADHQLFRFGEWPSGAFNTMTLAGSRPGGAVASAWAVLKYLGQEGYVNRVTQILRAKQDLMAALKPIAGVHVLGDPEASIVGIGGEDDLDMLAVRDGMEARGWRTGVLAEPPGMNLLLNFRHGEVVDEFAKDLGDVVAAVRAGKVKRSGERAVYGV
jgi:sphinganine-1-phosphate aldolase